MKRAILVNLAIIAGLIGYDLLTTEPGTAQYIPRLAFSGILILLLAVANLIVGMVRNRDKKGDGKYYIAASGVLLLIGFSVCTVN